MLIKYIRHLRDRLEAAEKLGVKCGSCAFTAFEKRVYPSCGDCKEFDDWYKLKRKKIFPGFKE